jgi:hypothetical protein
MKLFSKLQIVMQSPIICEPFKRLEIIDSSYLWQYFVVYGHSKRVSILLHIHDRLFWYSKQQTESQYTSQQIRHVY